MISRPLQGVGLYLCALAMFASMDACTKFLVQGLPVVQVTWARFAVSMLVVALAFPLSGRRIPWRSRAPRLQVVRSLCLSACNALFALALVHVPLAEATAVNYASPLIMVVMAAVLLHEQVGLQRWIGVGLGMAGVLVVLRPGGEAAHPAALIALGSATIFAFYQVLTRRLAAIDPPAVTIMNTGLWATLAFTVAVPWFWVWPDARSWALMGILGLLGAAGHFLLVLAYERASASLLAPMGYSGLVWAALFGLALFAEHPDRVALLGAAVIATGGLVVILAEARRRDA